MSTGTLSRYQNMVVKAESLIVNGNTITGTEIGYLDGLTAGTAAASKALVVDASINLAALNNLSMTGDLTVDGAAGTGSAAAGLIKLTTPETTVVAGDQIGRITATAPLEADGTDAIALAGFLAFEAGDTFSATVNDTDLVVGLGVSEAATAKYRFSPVAVHPEANDGAALGISGTAWADLFLASAGVINFNAGNYTITHSAGNLAFSGTVGVTGAITPTGGVAAAGGFTMSPRGIWVGQTAPQVSTDFNNSTPSTTETYVSEVFVPANCTITGIALFNGSDVTGNVTVGLADSTGAPIAAAKSASTAGSGTDALQRIPFAVAYAAKGPATYFIQVQYDSATARYNTHVLGNHGVLVQTSQSYGTFASFTPPTAFVTAVSNVAGLY